MWSFSFSRPCQSFVTCLTFPLTRLLRYVWHTRVKFGFGARLPLADQEAATPLLRQDEGMGTTYLEEQEGTDTRHLDKQDGASTPLLSHRNIATSSPTSHQDTAMTSRSSHQDIAIAPLVPPRDRLLKGNDVMAEDRIMTYDDDQLSPFKDLKYGELSDPDAEWHPDSYHLISHLSPESFTDEHVADVNFAFANGMHDVMDTSLQDYNTHGVSPPDHDNPGLPVIQVDSSPPVHNNRDGARAPSPWDYDTSGLPVSNLRSSPPGYHTRYGTAPQNIYFTPDRAMNPSPPDYGYDGGDVIESLEHGIAMSSTDATMSHSKLTCPADEVNQETQLALQISPAQDSGRHWAEDKERNGLPARPTGDNTREAEEQIMRDLSQQSAIDDQPVRDVIQRGAMGAEEDLMRKTAEQSAFEAQAPRHPPNQSLRKRTSAVPPSPSPLTAITRSISISSTSRKILPSWRRRRKRAYPTTIRG
jgi:hypothetical protein